MVQRLLRWGRAPLFAALVVSACTEPSGPPAPPPPPPILVQPNGSITIQRGTTIQFTATSEGAPVSVNWSVEPVAVGPISAAGLLSIVGCAPLGTAQVRATLQSDGSRSGTSAFVVSDLSQAPSASVSSMAYVPSAAPVVPDSIAGEIDVRVQFQAGLFPCKAILGARVELLSGAAVLPFTEVLYTPSLTEPQQRTIRWNSVGTPNGNYMLRVSVRKFDLSLVPSVSTPVRLRNP